MATDEAPPIDMTGFVRQDLHAGHHPIFTGGARRPWIVLERALAQGHAVDPQTDPDHVSFTTLRRMDTHPVVYLAEWASTGPARDADLYRVEHPDEEVRDFHDKWLRPLLPKVLPAVLRAFSYGVAPLVFDWDRERLVYRDVHELWPGTTEVELGEDRETVVGLRSLAFNLGGQPREFDRGRAHLAVWDRSYGSLLGASARRRAFAGWIRDTVGQVFHSRYIERSADPPRIARSPTGKAVEEQPDGTTRDRNERIQEWMLKTLDDLASGGTAVLPSRRDKDGNLLFDVFALDLPDREQVFQIALNGFRSQIMEAFFVPPGIVADKVPSAGAKALESLHALFLQCLVDWTAGELGTIVDKVHRVHFDSPAPEVRGREVPLSARKVSLEVLKTVSEGAQVADVVDVRDLLGRLGVKLRDPKDTAQPQAGGNGAGPGRPRDLTGGREERRADAQTTAGQFGVGAPGEAMEAKATRAEQKCKDRVIRDMIGQGFPQREAVRVAFKTCVERQKLDLDRLGDAGLTGDERRELSQPRRRGVELTDDERTELVDALRDDERQERRAEKQLLDEINSDDSLSDDERQDFLDLIAEEVERQRRVRQAQLDEIRLGER